MPIEEESYKAIKCRLQIENFSGKTLTAVLQDFHTKVLSGNLPGAFAHPAQDLLGTRYKHRRYKYQINFTQAISNTKDAIAILLHNPNSSNLILDTLALFMKRVEPIRHYKAIPKGNWPKAASLPYGLQANLVT